MIEQEKEAAAVEGLIAQKAAARRARQESGPGFDPLLSSGKAGRAGKVYSDSLLAVGNFLGAGRDGVARIQQQQLTALHSIDQKIAELGGPPAEDVADF